MSAWDELTGQEAAIRALQEAAADPDSMTHSWLITGPPGSGRSNLAYASSGPWPGIFGGSVQASILSLYAVFLCKLFSVQICRVISWVQLLIHDKFIKP